MMFLDEECDLNLDLESFGLVLMLLSNVFSLVIFRFWFGLIKKVGFDLCFVYVMDRCGKKKELEEEFGLLGSFFFSGNVGILKIVSVMINLNEK